MNKSNVESIPLTDEQANRLIQLVKPSFDECLLQTRNQATRTPVVWQPVLTDIHQQVVHTLGLVLIQHPASTEALSPTLSLLASPASQPAQVVGTVHQAGLTAELLPAPKPTL